MLTQILAERLTNLLEDRDMTQKELAEKSNISTSAISEWSKWENTREPRVGNLLPVAKALGVSMDYLLGADECKTPSNEEIHKITGLSDRAIESLISANHSMGTDNELMRDFLSLTERK